MVIFINMINIYIYIRRILTAKTLAFFLEGNYCAPFPGYISMINDDNPIFTNNFNMFQ